MAGPPGRGKLSRIVHTTLISTDALAAHLDGSWVIVDCRYDLKDNDWGRQQYRESHIPGAIYASLSTDLSAPPGTNGRHPIPAVDQLAATFGRMGIGPGTQVVMYDQDAGSYASRMWWMLRYLGHDAAAVLDGGYAKWTAERRPARSGDEPPRAAERFTPQLRPQMRRDLADVEAIVRSRSALLIDARAPERFEGQSETVDKKAGHIAGAVNYFYKWNLAADGTMLPAAALKDKFERLLAGKRPEEVVMYCGSGVTACHNLLAMEHVGLTGTPLYPGSWSEWSSDPARPAATGPATPPK
jgi:thiosulfate/3-mercaptopyruvate sulfurtransferase